MNVPSFMCLLIGCASAWDVQSGIPAGIPCWYPASGAHAHTSVRVMPSCHLTLLGMFSGSVLNSIGEISATCSFRDIPLFDIQFDAWVRGSIFLYSLLTQVFTSQLLVFSMYHFDIIAVENITL